MTGSFISVKWEGSTAASVMFRVSDEGIEGVEMTVWRIGQGTAWACCKVEYIGIDMI